MSDFKAKIHQLRFLLVLHPRPRRGSLQRSPDPTAGFKGVSVMGEGRDGRGKGKGGGLEEGGVGEEVEGGRPVKMHQIRFLSLGASSQNSPIPSRCMIGPTSKRMEGRKWRRKGKERAGEKRGVARMERACENLSCLWPARLKVNSWFTRTNETRKDPNISWII